MKKYLIIGGAGFIGSHLSKRLLELGHEVVVIDDFSAGVKDRNNGKIKVYKTNIESRDKIIKLFKKEKPDFVYHLAGAINLRRQITDPLFKKDMDILERTDSILEPFRLSGAKKFIFISSGGAIYENADIIPTPENYPSSPLSLYGLANLMIEKYIEIYCKNYNLNFVIPRLSNVYGPMQWESGIIPSIIINVLDNKRPSINGNGKQTRDFMYIGDAVDALILLAEKGKNGIYNIGTGKEVSINEVFKIAKKLLNSQIGAEYNNLANQETERSALDIQKITKELGWRPKNDIKDGLTKTIEWYKASN